MGKAKGDENPAQVEGRGPLVYQLRITLASGSQPIR